MSTTLPKPLRRPLVGSAVLWLAGTALGLRLALYCEWHLPLFTALLAISALIIALLAKSRFMAGAATAALLFLSGAFAGATAQTTLLTERQWLAENKKKPVYFHGTVDRKVGIKPPGRRRQHPVIPLRNVVVHDQNVTYRLHYTPVWVTWYGETEPPATGETWSFYTKLPKLDTSTFRHFLPLNGRASDALKLREPSFWDWRPKADQVRSAATRRLSLGIEEWPVVPALIQAMLLGTRSAVPYEINTIFRASGTIHVFAISGLGIGLVAAVMVACLSVLGVPRHRWGIPLLPMLTAYTLLTGASPSAMRACLMAIIYFGAPLLGRKADGPTTLGCAAIMQIAWNPPDLFNLSFILSYTAMVGLVILYQPFSHLCKRWFKVGSAARLAALYRLAERLSNRPRRAFGPLFGIKIAIFRHGMRLYLAELLAVGLAAWLASVPLTAYYFGRFIPGGLLANLVVVPSALMITVSGALALASSFVSSLCAEIFNNSAAFFTHLMVMASRMTVAIPWATMSVPTPPLWAVALWYGALFWFARFVHRLRAKAAAQQDDESW